MDKEQMTNDFKRLILYPEWKTFEKRIQEMVEIHKKHTVNYVAKDKMLDAQHQSWVVEGIMEALDEPISFIKYENSLKGKVANVIKEVTQKRFWGYHTPLKEN